MNASVTCVIPTHGRPDLVIDALDSALIQPEVLEVIIVDDLCDERTRGAVQRRAGASMRPRVRYVARSSGPPGASASRNRGAEEARTPWIAFLDDDDLWREGYLTAAVRELERTGADIAISWMSILDEQGERALLSISDGVTAKTAVARNPGVTGSNIVVRATAHSKIGGFDEDLPVSNDKDYFVRLLGSGARYVAVQERRVVHRRHGGPQLTAWTAQRAAGLELYARKHRDLAGWSERRFLRRQIHSIHSRTARAPLARLGHFLAMIAHSSIEDLRRGTGERGTG